MLGYFNGYTTYTGSIKKTEQIRNALNVAKRLKV